MEKELVLKNYRNNQKQEYITNKTKITEEATDSIFRTFLENCHRCKTKEDKDLLKKAYIFAKEAHKGQKRKTGDAFIYHCVKVAQIVTEDIGLGVTSAVCSLLHESINDTGYTVEDIKTIFDENISKIVESLQKIKGTANYFNEAKANVYKKIIEGISTDLRVILIKLADRLDNLRNIYCISDEKAKRIAEETQKVYVPIAHRIGLYKIKSELEDLAFKITKPVEYESIAKKIQLNERKKQLILNKLSLPIISALYESGIKFCIKGRQKTIYSIWSKMKRKNVNFNQVYDKYAIRVVYRETEDVKKTAYAIKNIIENIDIFEIVPERTRNWLDGKPETGYRALHITVRHKQTGLYLEIQIRSEKMDEEAEQGIAAHWKYKGINDESISDFDNKLKELKEKLEDIGENNFDFLKNFRLLFPADIVVYTPKGDPKTLPVEATVLDFAFAVHTEVGLHCIGAKVNHKLVPFYHKLENGDMVEVLTSQTQSPKVEWINYVHTQKALDEISKKLKDEEKNINILKGRNRLSNIFKEYNVKIKKNLIKEICNELYCNTLEDLYYKIGKSKNAYNNVENIVKRHARKRIVKYFLPTIKKQQNPKTGLFINEKQNYEYITAECCRPIPGDKVAGIKNKDIIFIHKKNCPTLVNHSLENPGEIIDLEWSESQKISHLTRINIEGDDDKGVVQKCLNIISNDFDINMKSIHIDSNEITFNGWVEIYVYNTKHLDKLINKIYSVKGVRKVWRNNV